MSVLSEATLSVDDFLNPDVKYDADAVATLLVRLLIMTPGTIQTHPDMGVGLSSKYRYSFYGNAAELKSDIKKQINKYLPILSGSTVEVTEKDHTYFITVQFSKTVFVITTDENNSVKSAYQTISNL